MADFARKPLPRYPEPAYPELHDHRAPAINAASAVKRTLALALVGVGVPLTTSGCFENVAMMGDAPSTYLTCAIEESAAREVLRAAFEEQGYLIHEDYPFGHGDVTFAADGYDKVATVGFEYQAHSEGDSLDYGVEETLYRWNQADGPFFLVLDELSYECYDGVVDEAAEAAALEQLRAQVESFFADLAEQGAI